MDQAREDATLLLAYAARCDRDVLTDRSRADKTHALTEAIAALDDADRAGSPATKEQRIHEPHADGAATSKLSAAEAQPVRAAREQLRQHAEHACDLVHRARMLLRALDAYVIPMLMGWLGALAYMLRSLVLQLRSDTYTPALASISLMRMVLGMIAGALGGMFVPAADESLKTLPPMALPFVFGYGVEILFSLLDRIVSAFPAVAPAKA